MLGRAQIFLSLGLLEVPKSTELELRWRCGMSPGGDGWQLRCLACRTTTGASPNPPKSAGGEPPMSEHISTAYVVIKAVAEQQGGRKALSKPYLCSQRHGAHGAEDGWGWLWGTGWGRQKGEAQQGWRLEGEHAQAEVMEKEDFLPDVPKELWVCCKAEGQEKWRRVMLPGCMGDKRGFMPSVSPSSSLLSLAALFKFVVLTSFTQTSTLIILWAPLASASGKKHGAVPALRGTWAGVVHF